MHARQTIREAVLSACTGLTTTGSNVTASRVYPHEDLPSLAIYTDSEELADRVMGERQIRDLVVTVEARAQAASGVDDTLDTICAEVEIALTSDSTIPGLVDDFHLTGVEVEFSGETEQPVGLAKMSWLFRYQVDATDPETIR